MQCYWRHNLLFAIYMEFSKDLGLRPYWKYRRIQKELMIEIPYGYVIITPARRLLGEYKVENSARQNGQRHGMRKHEKRDRRLFGTLKGATKN